MRELRPLRGEVTVPGDKGISHRALLFHTLVPGAKTQIHGLPDGEDVAATQAACQALGAEIVRRGDTATLRSPERLVTPSHVLDCGNSGTSIRLLLGALASSEVSATLDGDDSLKRRPMGRLVRPLREMGAHISGPSDGERAPILVQGRPLSPMRHVLPVASAQLKSALLLAGRSSGVSVREPGPSRDHSERMLRAMGADLVSEGGDIVLRPGPWRSVDVDVPGDLSSAAFLLVAAAIVPGSEIAVRGVGLNPTRTGVIDVLRAMGADLRAEGERIVSGEPVGDILVRHSPLVSTTISGDLALRSLDELVVLSIAAAFASGVTVISDARELRVKESDRIARVASGLRALGVAVEEREDGMVIEGAAGRVGRGARVRVDATGDHRIAMAFSVASLAAECEMELIGAESVRSSWPAFPDLLARLAQ